jgi:hypothetical protein
VTQDNIVELLNTIKTDKELQASKKQLSKQMTEGKLVTITGFLIKSEEKLGRSTIIDLAQPYGNGFRLVDHRTIEEFTIKNVKYTIKN